MPLDLVETTLETHTRVACPKFGHPVLSSEFYNDTLNTEFVAGASMYYEKKITIRKLNNFKTNRTLTISELWEGCPNIGHTTPLRVLRQGTVPRESSLYIRPNLLLKKRATK